MKKKLYTCFICLSLLIFACDTAPSIQLREVGQEPLSEFLYERVHSEQEKDGGNADTNEQIVEEYKEENLADEPIPSCKSAQNAVESTVLKWFEVSSQGDHLQYQTDPCSVTGFRFVAAKGMVLRFELSDIDRESNVEMSLLSARRVHYKVDEPAIVAQKNKRKDWIVFEKEITQSGEHYLTFDARQVPKMSSFYFSITCLKNCDKETTRFPIALVHGFAGTDKYFGTLEYYYKVKPMLEGKGYSVITPKTQPVAGSSTRVKPLKQQLDDFMKKTGARKIHLIAHSQGGLDSRYLISKMGYKDKVFSLTTIATPHQGMPVPKVDFIPLLKEMSTSYMKDFNKKYPNEAGILYFSWEAKTCGPLSFSCQRKHDGEVVEPLVITVFEFLKLVSGDNDGVVPTKSMKWGTLLGRLNADHWDQIGQIADRNNKPFNHLNFYLKEARRLKDLDL